MSPRRMGKNSMWQKAGTLNVSPHDGYPWRSHVTNLGVQERSESPENVRI
ncbi:hypothetical protein MGG_14670 [Pyricularia oryzae 70-15]|uniref:Uncharacterized protein n=4 Tax=Pyricularia oryzae TaxID=318829 RepID=G4NB80_PYRO7|nr:uncharacterized protein MGG_14670 [Pyricularia oryzae 70-15]EHA48842.1 hypothetical protein MGG_14670 [Pyricularia oryzae 70-15]ELQ38742.1 hypothetical protein OOU_Y34scaffold00528g34 [Pyricularia oryzae Y34]QBZ62673.1 hypothetical protein PoMZ_11556 [Pyricularia oryzae]